MGELEGEVEEVVFVVVKGKKMVEKKIWGRLKGLMNVFKLLEFFLFGKVNEDVFVGCVKKMIVILFFLEEVDVEGEVVVFKLVVVDVVFGR